MTTKQTTFTMEKMRGNLKAIFQAMKLESVPALKAEVRKNDEVYKEIVNKHFSSWKNYAMSEQALSTIAYFYNLEMFQACTKNCVNDFCNANEDLTDEQKDLLQAFISELARKACARISEGQSVNSKINTMMRAYKAKDFDMFSLCFKKFFGFEPGENDMEKLEILMLNGDTLRSNTSYRKTLCGIFTVLQGGKNNFKVKNVKTSFTDVTREIDIFMYDEIFDEDGHVRTELLNTLTKRYAVKLSKDYQWKEQHDKVLSALKKRAVFYPSALNEIDLLSKLNIEKLNNK